MAAKKVIPTRPFGSMLIEYMTLPGPLIKIILLKEKPITMWI